MKARSNIERTAKLSRAIESGVKETRVAGDVTMTSALCTARCGSGAR